jgi:hypothetical protein
MCTEDYSRSRLRVVTDVDPGACARVLERFQNLNILPRRIHVELGSNDRFYIEVDVFGVDEARRNAILAKISQSFCVISAHWHPV